MCLFTSNVIRIHCLVIVETRKTVKQTRKPLVPRAARWKNLMDCACLFRQCPLVLSFPVFGGRRSGHLQNSHRAEPAPCHARQGEESCQVPPAFCPFLFVIGVKRLLFWSKRTVVPGEPLLVFRKHCRVQTSATRHPFHSSCWLSLVEWFAN